MASDQVVTAMEPKAAEPGGKGSWRALAPQLKAWSVRLLEFGTVQALVQLCGALAKLHLSVA